MLAAQALRLSFHDCVGGCDGCVNVAQAANIGLGRIYDILDKDWEEQRDNIGKANNPIICRILFFGRTNFLDGIVC